MAPRSFGFGSLLTGRPTPADVEMPDGLPVTGGLGSPKIDAFLALQGQRLKDAFLAPSRALSGELPVYDPETGHTTDAAREAAGGLAGLAMTGGLGGAAAHAGETVLGSGPKAVRRLTYDSPLRGMERVSKVGAEREIASRQAQIADAAASG